MADESRELRDLVRVSRDGRQPLAETLAAAPAAKAPAGQPPVKVPPKRQPRTAPPPVAAPSGAAAAVVAFALRQVGKPYVFGASGPNAYDCSGLTAAAYAQAGIRLPHQSGAQRAYGRAITRAQLAPGDLILYPGHVAIYVGNGRMVHAANPRKGVLVAAMYGTPSGYRRLL